MIYLIQPGMVWEGKLSLFALHLDTCICNLGRGLLATDNMSFLQSLGIQDQTGLVIYKSTMNTALFVNATIDFSENLFLVGMSGLVGIKMKIMMGFYKYIYDEFCFPFVSTVKFIILSSEFNDFSDSLCVPDYEAVIKISMVQLFLIYSVFSLQKVMAIVGYNNNSQGIPWSKLHVMLGLCVDSWQFLFSAGIYHQLLICNLLYDNCALNYKFLIKPFFNFIWIFALLFLGS